MGTLEGHEMLTLSDVVVSGAFSVRGSLERITGLDLARIDDRGWSDLTIEYAVLHLFLMTEYARQVLDEYMVGNVMGEIADGVTQGLAERLAPTRAKRREVMKAFGETYAERLAQYAKQPVVVDPEAGDRVEVTSFERLRGTVFGTFVDNLVLHLFSGQDCTLPPNTPIDLWLDSLARAEAWSHVYAPLLDLIQAKLKVEPPGASR